MEHCDVLSDCGFVKPIATLTLEDKVAAVHSITLHHVILQCKAELDQICKGIQDVGILKALRLNYDLFRTFFGLHGRGHLTAGMKYLTNCTRHNILMTQPFLYCREHSFSL